jgi:hypothetical protein
VPSRVLRQVACDAVQQRQLDHRRARGGPGLTPQSFVTSTSRLPQHLEAPRRQPHLVSLCHRVSTSGRWPEDQNAICYRCLGISQTEDVVHLTMPVGQHCHRPSTGRVLHRPTQPGPHSAFRGQTPDEMYFGTGGEVPVDLTSRAAAARRTRVEANRSAACGTCPSIDAAA